VQKHPSGCFFERSLDMLDATVGSILGESTLTRRGSALAERADTLSSAARLDAAATQKQQRVDAELKAARDTAVEDQKKAREAKERDVQNANRSRTAHNRRSAGCREAHRRGATAEGRTRCPA